MPSKHTLATVATACLNHFNTSHNDYQGYSTITGELY